MTSSIDKVLRIAGEGFRQADEEHVRLARRQRRTIRERIAQGDGDCLESFTLSCRFRLVFVRCHFAGASGTAPMTLSLDCHHGPAFDTRLFTVTQAGPGVDVHLRLDQASMHEPSAWTFDANDAVLITWTNPHPQATTWGLQVGLVPAT